MTEQRPARARAFDEFVELEFENVVALALGLLGDEDDAVDVAQEVMLRTFQRWDRVASMDRPGAWSRRVALNLVTDRLRGRTRRRRLLARLRDRTPLHDAGAADDDVGTWDATFWAHVSALPRRQRDVVALHYVLDLSVVEIAGIVDRPDGTVKSDLSRARASLREVMAPDGGTDNVDREGAT